LDIKTAIKKEISNSWWTEFLRQSGHVDSQGVSDYFDENWDFRGGKLMGRKRRSDGVRSGH
jgi:hypothetical protein